MTMVATFKNTEDSELVTAINRYWSDADVERQLTREEFMEDTNENAEDIFDLPRDSKIELTATQWAKAYEAYRDTVRPIIEQINRREKFATELAQLLVKYEVYSEESLDEAKSDADEFAYNYDFD